MKFSMKFIFKSFGVKFICLMYILPFLLLADDLREDDFQEFTFDDSLLFGGYGDNYISRFNSAAEEIPGQYQVDIYINNTYLNSQIIDFYISDSKKYFLA